MNSSKKQHDIIYQSFMINSRIEHLQRRARLQFQQTFIQHLAKKQEKARRQEQLFFKAATTPTIERCLRFKDKNKQKKPNLKSPQKEQLISRSFLEEQKRKRSQRRLQQWEERASQLRQAKQQERRRQQLARSRSLQLQNQQLRQTRQSFKELLGRIRAANEKKEYLLRDSRKSVVSSRSRQTAVGLVRQQNEERENMIISRLLSKQKILLSQTLSAKHRKTAYRSNKLNGERTSLCWRKRQALFSQRAERSASCLNSRSERFSRAWGEVQESRREALQLRRKIRLQKEERQRELKARKQRQRDQRTNSLITALQQSQVQPNQSRQVKPDRARIQEATRYQSMLGKYREMSAVLDRIRHGQGDSRVNRRIVGRLAGDLFALGEGEREVLRGVSAGKEGLGGLMRAIDGQMELLRRKDWGNEAHLR